MAELEEALVRYALDAVKKLGFQLISVPDILYPHVIESCGMKTRSDRDQVIRTKCTYYSTIRHGIHTYEKINVSIHFLTNTFVGILGGTSRLSKF